VSDQDEVNDQDPEREKLLADLSPEQRAGCEAIVQDWINRFVEISHTNRNLVRLRPEGISEKDFDPPQEEQA
jgi:hypothetical protein